MRVLGRSGLTGSNVPSFSGVESLFQEALGLAAVTGDAVWGLLFSLSPAATPVGFSGVLGSSPRRSAPQTLCDVSGGLLGAFRLAFAGIGEAAWPASHGVAYSIRVCVWYLSGQVPGLYSEKSPRNHCDTEMCTIVPVVHRCGLHFLVLRRFGDNDANSLYTPPHVPDSHRTCTRYRHRGRAASLSTVWARPGNMDTYFITEVRQQRRYLMYLNN